MFGRSIRPLYIKGNEHMRVMKPKKFKQILDSSDTQEIRNQVITELIEQAMNKINCDTLDKTNRYEILEAISYFVKKNKLSSNRAYKIFLLAEYGVELVNKYEMRGTQCIPRHYLNKHKQPQTRERVVVKRRARIYDWTGCVVPRSYLDRLKHTKINTQTDYDRMRERETGMSKETYQEARYLGKIFYVSPRVAK